MKEIDETNLDHISLAVILTKKFGLQDDRLRSKVGIDEDLEINTIILIGDPKIMNGHHHNEDPQSLLCSFPNMHIHYTRSRGPLALLDGTAPVSSFAAAATSGAHCPSNPKSKPPRTSRAMEPVRSTQFRPA
jgi:hypothetical protein